MRRVLFTTTIVLPILAGFASMAPADAQGRYGYGPRPGIQDRYCLQGRIWGYPGNCQFSSYRQCMASASGTNAYCGINPSYAYARERRPY